MPPGSARLETRRRSLPEGEPLAARFDMVRARSQDAPEHAFALLVPKAFAADGSVERRPDRAPGDWLEIGAFRSPERDAIEVSLAPLGRDVSLADFVAWVIEREGLEPVSVDPLDFGGREAVDALVRVGPTEEEFLSPEPLPPRLARFVVFRRGGSLVRLLATASATRWGPLSHDFAWSVSSLRFDALDESTFLEPYVWSASAGAVPLGFRRPASWLCEEKQDVPWGREVLDLRRVEDGAVTDLLRAIAVDRDTAGDVTLASLAAEALEGLRAEGLSPGQLRRRSTPVSPGDPFKAPMLATVHEGRAFGGPSEVRVTCLETPRALYALAAVIPAHDPDRVGWMCGKRVHDVALQTLLRPDESILTPEASRRAARAAVAASESGSPDPVSPVGRGDASEEE